jgi:hypothetical protein
MPMVMLMLTVVPGKHARMIITTTAGAARISPRLSWPLRASGHMAALTARPVMVGLATYAAPAPRAAVRVLVQMALSARRPTDRGRHRAASHL